ncbi:unnamed protein product [Ixodes pacificus]
MKIATKSSVQNYLAPGTCEQSTVPPPPQLPNLNAACKTHESVTNAEVSWTLKVVTSHCSYRSSSQAAA